MTSTPFRAAVIGMVWGQSRNGLIGREGMMPWHLAEDVAHFRAVTFGHPVIMGRSTWESLPAESRPLPGGPNIVIAAQPNWSAPGATRAGNFYAALVAAGTAAPEDQIWIMGAACFDTDAMDLADTAVITRIDFDIEGDAFAPALGPEWVLAAADPADGWHTSKDGTRYRFETWQRD